MEPITQKDLELELLKNNKAEREASDGKYAPIIVKTILYGLLAALASGVVLGMGNLVTEHFISSLDQPAQNAIPAAAVKTIYDNGTGN